MTSSRINSRHQQLILLRAPVERPQQQRLDHDAEQRDHQGPDRDQQKGPAGGNAECNRAPHQPGGGEGPDGKEGSMRHVDDAHDPEDEAQPGGDEEKDGGVEQRIEDLDDQYRHRIRLLSLVVPCRVMRR
jgi:hypothetical protein